MQEVAYVNGVFCPMDQAKVSINDRGFQYGDSIYEVIAAYAGRPFQLEAHLDRLRASLEALSIPLDLSTLKIESVIREGLRRCGFEEAMAYIQISRGEAPRSHIPPADIKPTIVMTFRALPPVPAALRKHGASIMTAPEIRWAKCYIKATTLLPNVLTRMQARAAGFHDAIFVADGGDVREGTSSNVALVRGGRLLFPCRDQSILHGVTLLTVTECAAHLDIPWDERPVNVRELLTADEVFLTSTTEEVLPVTRIDGNPIGDGDVGPITRRMMETYADLTRGRGVFESRLRHSA
ncbi:MAG: D-alanine aminotransferase [Planctomycetota bacterium]|nr:MAG: D-alanine aminotransferase [Planctomycetota bacterium]